VPPRTGRNADTVRRQAVSLRRALRARLRGPRARRPRPQRSAGVASSISTLDELVEHSLPGVKPSRSVPGQVLISGLANPNLLFEVRRHDSERSNRETDPASAIAP
jgi:hypothetical protein